MVPPLRERVEDIPLLLSHFLARYSLEMGRNVKEIAPEAVDVLTHYPWPGNVRELQNVLKRALALSKGEVLTLSDLPDEVVMGSAESRNQGEFFKLRSQKLASFEQKYLKDLLVRFKGDVAKAAAEANIPRGTFYRLMNKYQLRSTTFKD